MVTVCMQSRVQSGRNLHKFWTTTAAHAMDDDGEDEEEVGRGSGLA